LNEFESIKELEEKDRQQQMMHPALNHSTNFRADDFDFFYGFTTFRSVRSDSYFGWKWTLWQSIQLAFSLCWLADVIGHSSCRYK